MKGIETGIRAKRIWRLKTRERHKIEVYRERVKPIEEKRQKLMTK